MINGIDAVLRQIRASQKVTSAGSFEIIVETRSQTDVASLARAVQGLLEVDARVQQLFPKDDLTLERFFRVTIPGVTERELRASPFDVAYVLKDAFDLASAEPDLTTEFYIPASPPLPGREAIGPLDCWVDSPPPDDRLWALKRICALEAWKWSTIHGNPDCGTGILIAQPDTGVAKHDELTDALDLARATDLVDADKDPTDPLDNAAPWENPGHGTGTASVVASRLRGLITGAAPKAKLVPIRCIESVVRITQSRVALAIDHARRTGCHVVTMSLGGLPSAALKAAIRRANDDNVLVLAAAGNCVGWVVWPAAYDDCLAVAATNVADRPWKGSSHGSAIDISAPGELVWRAKREKENDPTDGVSAGQGTSFAVALTAGAAAVWLAHHGRDTLIKDLASGERLQQRFRRQLQATARRPATWDPDEFGPGIVNTEELLKAGMGKAAPATEALPSNDAARIAEILAQLVGLAHLTPRTETAFALGMTPGELERYGVELTWLAFKTRLQRIGGSHAAESGSQILPPRMSKELRVMLSRETTEPMRRALTVNTEHQTMGGQSMVQLSAVDKPTEPSGALEGLAAEVTTKSRTTTGSAGRPAEASRFLKHLVVKGKSGPLPPRRARSLGLETVIGLDDRTRILDTELPPWRMICALEMRGPQGAGAIGTGWLVGPKTLITAGHCVYSNTFFGGWAGEIAVSAGRNGEEYPYRTVKSRRLSSLDAWVKREDPDFDIGCVHLETSLGDEVGWFAVGALTPDDLTGYLVNVAGYPGDRGSGTEQYHHRNRVLRVTDRRVFYDVDTYGGQSGAPVWIHRAAEDPPLVIGIHAYGVGGTPANFNIEANSAPRIIPEVLRQIESWVEEDGGWSIQ